MTRIRIVTINTAKGDFDYSRRLLGLASGLVSLQSDIVFLQESLATIDGTLDTAKRIADALQLSFVYAPARRKTRLVDGAIHDTFSGLAILGRYPVEESIVVPLPADVADGERIGLLAKITIGESKLLLGNIHLTHLSGSDADAMRRIEFATLLAHPWFQDEVAARIVGGDLNTKLPALRAVIGHHAGFEVRDSWIDGGGAGPRATVPVTMTPDDSRGYCLDYLLSVASATVDHPRFEDASVVLGTADIAGRYPSDHRGIATTLFLNDGAQR